MGDLLSATAELVAIQSVSHDETAIADHVAARLVALPWLRVDRIGDNVVARTEGSGERVLLAGHLDTVPANGNATPVQQGDTLHGLGAADMKGGLAVMLALAEELRQPPRPLTYVFYAAEEVARADNGLLAIARERPDLLEAEVAILGEPTSARIEAGCQGVLKIRITLGGSRAHSARPWTGVNALHRMGPVLVALAALGERCPVIDGCTYRETTSVVAVEGGVAGNVVPDRATLVVSHRFAPDRSGEDAERAMRAWLAPHLDPTIDAVEVIDLAPSAAPNLGHPVLATLRSAVAEPARAKLGWTDVAFFAERGTPAVNFGPGDPEVAHTAGEKVARAELELVHTTLATLLG